jgi:putative two-component system response regulator
MSKSSTGVEPVSDAVRRLLDEAAAIQGANPDRARQITLQARMIARADGDRSGEAESLYRLSSIAFSDGRTDDAFGLASEASHSAKSWGVPLVESWAEHLLAIVHYQAANFSEALEHALTALDAYRSVGEEPSDEANFLNTIALIHQAVGDSDRAIVTYEAALAVNQHLGRPDIDAVTLGNIARLRAGRSEYLLAVSLGRRAVELAREHVPEYLSELLADLAEAYVGLADHRQAAACFAEARKLWIDSAELGVETSPRSQLALMIAEGRVALRRGALDEAISVLSSALELAHKTELPLVELETHELLTSAFKRAGRFEEALDHQEKRFELHKVVFNASSDLRVRTLQIAYDASTARQQAEIMRLQAAELEQIVHGLPNEPATYQIDSFERLAVFAEMRDGEDGQHTRRVGDLAAEIAVALGEPTEACERLRVAARLHDIGKVAVPDVVSLKPGPLSVDDFEKMKLHTTAGHQILAGNSSALFQLAAEAALTHHEWWDGSGYPHGLRGDVIPLAGRIVAVADVFEALTGERVYKRAWPVRDAVRYVLSGRGTQFQPEVVDAFLLVVAARYPQLDVSVL